MSPATAHKYQRYLNIFRRWCLRLKAGAVVYQGASAVSGTMATAPAGILARKPPHLPLHLEPRCCSKLQKKEMRFPWGPWGSLALPMTALDGELIVRTASG